MTRKIRVRFIGDKKIPQGENVKYYLIKMAEQEGVGIDYDEVIHQSSQIALQIALNSISNDERWQQFEALVLDLRYPPPGGAFDGLDVVWKGLLESRRTANGITDVKKVVGPPLPWENVYVTTIWFENFDSDMKRAVVDKMVVENLLPGNVFGAGPLSTSYKRLAKKLIADVLKKWREQSPA